MAQVELYHNNASKLATTSTGIDVTGNYVNSGNLLHNNNSGLKIIGGGDATNAGSNLTLYGGSNASAGTFRFRNGTATHLEVAGNGDISFYEDTGTTAKLFWDASAESLTLNSTLKVEGGTTNGFVQASGTSFQIGASTASNLIAYTNNTERLRIASNGDISFYEDTGTTPKFFWDASAERLGIGTSSPTQALDVSGNMISNGRLILTNTGSSVDTGSVSVGTLAGGFYANTPSGKPIYHAVAGTAITYSDANTHWFKTAGTERLRIDSSGNVGIGTSSPTFSAGGGLNVANATFATMRARGGASTGVDFAQGNDGKGYVYVRDNADLIFGTNNTERMRIDSSGNVGIGTTSPTRTLDVSRAGSTILANFKNTGGATSFITLGNTSSTADQIRVGSNGTAFTVSTNYAERMRIDSSGNVGIGTSSPTYKLNVLSAAGVQNIFQAGQSGISNGLSITSDGSALTYSFLTGNVGIGTSLPSAKLDVNGEVYVSPNTAGKNTFQLTTNASNDARLKMLSDTTLKVDIQANGASYFNGGNVGIGTSSPTSGGGLTLSSSTTAQGFIDFKNTVDGDSGYIGNAKALVVGGATNQLGVRGGTSGIAFSVASAEAMRIDSSRNVGIGTSSPAYPFVISDGGNIGFEFSPDDQNTGVNRIYSYDRGTSAYKDFKLSASQIIFGYGSSGGNEAMRIDSSGNVGIGTTSPVAPLNIKKDGAVSGGGWSTLLQATDENSNKGVTLGFDEASQTSIILATSSAAASDMAFWTYSGSAWGERMRIDSSGNVGIGVVPSADNFFTTLEIGNTGNGLVGRGPADTHFMSGLIWDGGSTQEYTVSSVAVGKYQITNGIHYWGTAPAGTAGTAATLQTNMMLDASGNVLVGKTASDLGVTAGIELNGQYDVGYFTRSAEKALVVNRLSTDGTIAEFRKDGTAVGSIGARGGDVYLETGDTGIRMYDQSDAIIPVGSAGVSRDAAIDLGLAPNLRFKDLYLSGNSYANTYRHDGDSDTYFNFPAENQLSLVAGGATILKAYQIAGAYGVLEAHGSGSATYPNFTFNGDSNTGMYRATTDALGFTTGGSEAMRIDSSGNLLVGVTSTTLTGGSLTLPNSGIIAFHDAAGNARNSLQFVSGELKHGAAGAGLTSQTFFTSATERMRIDSSGNVGIGISPVEQLHLGGRTHPVFELQANSTSGTGRINFSDTTVRGQILYEHTDDSMRLLTAATERLRIDSSGNLMVGTTDSAPAVSSSEVGVALSGPFGYVAASRSAGASGFFNRLSDGDIVNFNKDGTLVGSIGSTAGSMYIEGNPATSKVGLTFFGSTIEPRDAGAVSDGGVDLGASGSRFKDLYLSGGAYIKGQLAVTGPQVITANTTAVSGSFLTVKTAGITITLPASPSVGDFVLVKDGTGAASTSSFTVARNGQNIASSATDLTFDVNFGQITLTYVDATIGWSV
jgi:hypothetical protein